MVGIDMALSLATFERAPQFREDDQCQSTLGIRLQRPGIKDDENIFVEKLTKIEDVVGIIRRAIEDPTEPRVAGDRLDAGLDALHDVLERLLRVRGDTL
ncbi:hypothetical protein MUK72_00295 [Halococcus dombrowskii]|uniref:Uncharacterized protein n=1 Tax=Halococcus dombrowskii TaxID=179637 RepID=A0AAX3AQ95_HALDO|nr:hypothetical protein [Halococcus dombrowskii]UOO95180.1 hypothetical protein MUK72_00295 [Halococcus dombrowskii]